MSRTNHGTLKHARCFSLFGAVCAPFLINQPKQFSPYVALQILLRVRNLHMLSATRPSPPGLGLGFGLCAWKTAGRPVCAIPVNHSHQTTVSTNHRLVTNNRFADKNKAPTHAVGLWHRDATLTRAICALAQKPTRHAEAQLEPSQFTWYGDQSTVAAVETETVLGAVLPRCKDKDQQLV